MLSDFLTHLAAAGRSKGTIELRRYQLKRFHRDIAINLEDIKLSDLETFLANPSWKTDYRRSMRTSVVTYFTWLHATNRIPVNPAVSLAPVKAAPPKPRPTPETAYRQALEVADERDRLFLRLGAECGLRRAEVAVMRVDDVFTDLLGKSLLVHGKGDKDRIVPLNDDLARELQRYTRGRSGYVFPGNRNGHLSPQRIGNRISKLLPDGVTMHTLRHRFATRVYAASNDILATQQLLGHSSPAITQRYVAVDYSRLRAVAAAA